MFHHPSDNKLHTISDHLARTIKLSQCYLTFYIVQMAMAGTLCGLLFFDQMDYVPFVEIPIAFFIGLDMYLFIYQRVLSHFMESRRQLCDRIQIVNMLVLFGSVSIIGMDLAIPHITKNRIHLMFEIIRNLRYGLQTVWILKLGFESRKLFIANKQNPIKFDLIVSQMDEDLSKMAL